MGVSALEKGNAGKLGEKVGVYFYSEEAWAAYK